jgi:hypothetical protein
VEAFVSYLYCVREMPYGAIKIGVSGNPWSRVLVDLQAGNSRELRLLLVLRVGRPSMRGTDFPMRRIERQWHERFAHLRIRGEWFRPEPELLDEILRVASTDGRADR